MKKLFLILFLLFSPLAYFQPAQATLTECKPGSGARWDYTGNGSTTNFPYTCRIVDDEHLKVIVRTIAGVATTQVLGTDYTVTGMGNANGGNVVFTTAPATGVRVSILRNQPKEQASKYILGEGFPSERVEKDLDKIVMQLQQHDEILRRVPKLREHETHFDVDLDDPGDTGVIPSSTVAKLPPVSAEPGTLRRVTDGADSTDCTTGGGSSEVTHCNWDGTAWVFTGSAGAAITANAIGAAEIDETNDYAFSAKLIASSIIASFPAAGTAERFRWARDGSTATDCEEGEGTELVLCYDDGFNWVSVFAAVGSTPTIKQTFDASADGNITGVTESKTLGPRGSGAKENDGWDIYTDSTNGPQIKCVIGGVRDDCDYFRGLAAGKKWGVKDRNGTEIFTLTEAVGSGALTNITLDVESSGNTVTTVSKHSFPTVACDETTGSLLWDTVNATKPTPNCSAGTTETTLIRGVADFPDADGDHSLQVAFLLPDDLTGTADLKFVWRAAATTGDAVWQATLSCAGDGQVDDQAFNTPSTVTDTAKGTANQLNVATITGLTLTGCDGGDLAHLKVFRNRTHASDTITGVISLAIVEATIRRAQ